MVRARTGDAGGEGLVNPVPEPIAAGTPLPPTVRPEKVGMSPGRLARIDAALEADIAGGRIPGAVVVVARRGGIAYARALGYRDKAAGTPMTLDAIFNIASMTKPATVVTALTLYEEGRLLIDQPLADFFPAFATCQVALLDETGDHIVETVPAARAITLRDLMRHTCGIAYGGRGSTAVHKLLPASSAALTAMRPAEVVAALSGPPLLHQPGAVWDYGFGLDLLGLVIEQVTGQTLGQAMRERVLAPLGMADTGFLVPPEKAARYAKALPNDPDTGKPQSLGLDLTQPMRTECGGGGLGSTPFDYLRFALMLLGKGRLGATRILGRKTAEYMLADQLGPSVRSLMAQADPTRADYGFGLGLAVRTRVGGPRMTGSVGEFSWPGASGTNWWADPQEDLVAVVMMHAPGPVRWYYRERLAALVNQAIDD
jgi:CubicO group peptidase (beta-lactamase class C family)